MLDLAGLNYGAILVAWLLNMALGSFWYSPAGFGKLWSKLSGVNIMKIPKNEANKAIVFVALGALLQTSVLSVIINSLHAISFTAGAAIGFVLWLGLTAATTIGNTLYARLSWKFWWLNSSFFLIVMVIGAGLLAAWR